MESYDTFTFEEFIVYTLFWLLIIGFFGIVIFFIVAVIKSYKENKIKQEKVRSILNFSFEEKLDDYIQIGITGKSGGYNPQDILKHTFFLVFNESMFRFAIIEILDGALNANEKIEIRSYKTSENIIEEQISTTKTKGRIGRAVVGGALFGGVGAVVGGLTGKSETVTETEIVDYSITVRVDTYHDEIRKFGFTVDPRVAEKWVLRFEKAITTNKEKSGQNHSVSNRLIPISIADEISKLKELQFNGIISEAEFENQKQKLLNS
jgi:hypothetical protein